VKELTDLYWSFNIHEIDENDTSAQDTATAQGEEGLGDSATTTIEQTLAQLKGGYQPNMNP